MNTISHEDLRAAQIFIRYALKFSLLHFDSVCQQASAFQLGEK